MSRTTLHPDAPWSGDNHYSVTNKIIELSDNEVAVGIAHAACLILGATIEKSPDGFLGHTYEAVQGEYIFGNWKTPERAMVAFCMTMGVQLEEGNRAVDTKIYFKNIGETKGTGKYSEVNSDGTESFSPKVGTLYVRKSAMENGRIPQMLEVSIKEVPHA